MKTEVTVLASHRQTSGFSPVISVFMSIHRISSYFWMDLNSFLLAITNEFKEIVDLSAGFSTAMIIVDTESKQKYCECCITY